MFRSIGAILGWLIGWGTRQPRNRGQSFDGWRNGSLVGPTNAARGPRLRLQAGTPTLTETCLRLSTLRGAGWVSRRLVSRPALLRLATASDDSEMKCPLWKPIFEIGF